MAEHGHRTAIQLITGKCCDVLLLARVQCAFAILEFFSTETDKYPNRFCILTKRQKKTIQLRAYRRITRQKTISM